MVANIKFRFIKTVLLLLLLISGVNLHSQTYALDKALSKNKIMTSDSLTSGEKSMLSMGVSIMQIYLVISTDSVQIITDGNKPSSERESLNNFYKTAAKIDDNIILESFMVFSETTDAIDINKVKNLQEELLKIERINNEAASILENIIVFDALTLNFDTLHAGDIYEAKFVFTNMGDNPLEILDVKTSCGCTVPSWTNKNIPAGYKDTITVTYNTKNKHHGKSRRKITVKHNLIDQPINLYLEGFIINETKGELNSDKLLNKSFAGDTLNLEALNIKKDEFNKLIQDLNKIQEFLGGPKKDISYKFEEFTIVDTLENNMYLMQMNWEKYYSIMNELKTLKKTNKK